MDDLKPGDVVHCHTENSHYMLTYVGGPLCLVRVLRVGKPTERLKRRMEFEAVFDGTSSPGVFHLRKIVTGGSLKMRMIQQGDSEVVEVQTTPVLRFFRSI